MRLIDADEMKKCLCGWDRSLVELVDAVPTAYDVDKVVEQLEELKEIAEKEVKQGKGILIKEPYTPYIKAIEIVKAGGKE